MSVDVAVLFALTASGLALAAGAYLVSKLACRRFAALDEADRRLSERVDALERKEQP